MGETEHDNSMNENGNTGESAGRFRIIALILVLSTLCVYIGVTRSGFVQFDDDLYVFGNRYVRNGLTVDSISWAFSFRDKQRLYFQPLTFLSHMLDSSIFGLRPGGHHFSNLVLHILNILLLFHVLRRATGETGKSAFVAALFALHPLNVESVAWISSKKNVLSTFFWMLTMVCYIRYVKRPDRSNYMVLVFVFLLGLLAKPMVVTLPFVLLMMDIWPLGRFGFLGNRIDDSGVEQVRPIKLIVEKIPLFLLSFGFIRLSSLSTERFGDVVSFDSVSFALRLKNALVSYPAYIGKAVFPVRLSNFYPFPSGVPTEKAVAAGVTIALVSLLAVILLKKKPWFAFGWFWFLGTLVPASGLVQVGLWPKMADRFTYIPMIGFFILVSWGAGEILKSLFPGTPGKKAAFSISCIILAVLGFLTIRQVSYWKDDIHLFSHAVAVNPQNYIMQNSLGVALAQKGNYSEAEARFRLAIRQFPEFDKAHYNLGKILAGTGRIDEAIIHYKKALRIDPSSAQTHVNLGAALSATGKPGEAVKHYLTAIRIDPRLVPAYINLGNMMLRSNRINEALTLYQKALEIDPGNPAVLGRLAEARKKKGWDSFGTMPLNPIMPENK